MATEYEHNGVLITFEEKSGGFRAIINEVMVRCASLPAIKKKIDAAKAGNFKPFDAWVWRYGTPIKVRIVGVTDGKRGYSKRWVDKDGQSFIQAFPATTETLHWMNALTAMQERHGEETAKLRQRHQNENKGHAALVPAIPMLGAS